MPGSTPPTSQLDWLSSTTAMIVVLWSRATRDLLKSFGWGIAALHRLDTATKLPRSLPGERGDGLNDLPIAAEEIRAALLDTFDRQRQINAAARLVARHLTLDHSPDSLASLRLRLA
jgi:hypothetical protein